MNSRRPELLAPPSPGAAALAIRALPALLALLLLALPAVCVAHCLTATNPVRHAAHAAGDGQAHFFCELPMPAARDLFVPAFFPGVLPRLAAFVAATVLLRALTPLSPAPLRPLLLSPPTPPPRRLKAEAEGGS